MLLAGSAESWIPMVLGWGWRYMPHRSRNKYRFLINVLEDQEKRSFCDLIVILSVQRDPSGLAQGFVDLNFPRLVGRYCSYLLPNQDGGTTQI